MALNEDILAALGGTVQGSPTQDQLTSLGQPVYQSLLDAAGKTQAPASGGNQTVQALVAAYQKYLRNSKRQQDPLFASLRGQQGAGRGLDQTQNLGGMPGAFRSTHGAMEGQIGQRYNLGGGRFANVYYDENGKRKVNVFTAPQGQ